MMSRLALCVAVLAWFLPDTVTASTVFAVDHAASYVTIVNQQSDAQCGQSTCGFSAELAFDSDFAFSVDVGQTFTFDFVEWTTEGTGGFLYDVEAFLSFTSPAGASTHSAGEGFGVVLNGSMVLGSVSWKDVPNLVTLSNGSQLTVDFESGVNLLPGGAITTSTASVFAEAGANPDFVPDLRFPLYSTEPVWLNTEAYTGLSAFGEPGPYVLSDFEKLELQRLRNQGKTFLTEEYVVQKLIETSGHYDFYHDGTTALDIDVNAGTADVIAAQAGTIVAITGLGRCASATYPCLVISHGDYQTEYREFSALTPELVELAEMTADQFEQLPDSQKMVVAGQTLGRLDGVQGDHLHFQIIQDSSVLRSIGGTPIEDFVLPLGLTQGKEGFVASRGDVFDQLNSTVGVHTNSAIHIGESLPGEVLANGPIAADVDGSIFVGPSGKLTVVNNATIRADQVFSSGGILHLAQTLRAGVDCAGFDCPGIHGDVTIEGGRVIVGSSPGYGLILGNVLFEDTLWEVDISGLEPGEYDLLEVMGSATLRGGTVRFNFLDGFLPSAGDMVSFIFAHGLLGFSEVNLEYLGAAPGFLFDVVVGENGSLRFMALSDAAPVPIPAALPLFAAGLGGLGLVSWLSWRRRRVLHQPAS